MHPLTFSVQRDQSVKEKDISECSTTKKRQFCSKPQPILEDRPAKKVEDDVDKVRLNLLRYSATNMYVYIVYNNNYLFLKRPRLTGF
jgi:hypothetical protein